MKSLEIFILACSLMGYFLLHSALASLKIKKWVAARHPQMMPAYRLMFNLVAILTFLPIIWQIGRQSWPVFIEWHGLAKLLADCMGGLAMAGFVWSLKYYDLQEFFGLRQLRNHVTNPEDQEHFHLSPLHRFVRHPWYFFGMLLLWTRDLNMAQAVVAVMATVYFAIGSRLEEQKLLLYHGEKYQRYRSKVAGLIPIPWKYLSKAEAEGLISSRG